MKRLAFALTLPIALAACAPMMTSTDPDVQFAISAAHSNWAEISTSQIALTKSNNAAVLAYARDMIAMHTQMQNELRTVAKAKGITVPEMPAPEQLLQGQRLAQLAGAEFDAEYSRVQLNAHRFTLGFFDAYINGNQGDDADIRALAVKGRPMIQQHRDRARTELPVPADALAADRNASE